MTKERFDIHQHITDKIVSAIERGAGEFCLPWHRGTGNIMRPVNIASKKAYRGVNVSLWAHSERPGRKNLFNDDTGPSQKKDRLAHGHDFRQPSRDRGGRFSLPFHGSPVQLLPSSVPSDRRLLRATVREPSLDSSNSADHDKHTE
jgi:N-terminal domain of anti-restriction factor ArdC